MSPVTAKCEREPRHRNSQIPAATDCWHSDVLGTGPGKMRIPLIDQLTVDWPEFVRDQSEPEPQHKYQNVEVIAKSHHLNVVEHHKNTDVVGKRAKNPNFGPFLCNFLQFSLKCRLKMVNTLDSYLLQFGKHEFEITSAFK